VAVASGIASARTLLEEIKAGRASYDFVEVGVKWRVGAARL
jgi:hypothetical protein